MLYIPSLAVISQTFPAKHRPLAIGVSSSGAAIGGIVLPIMFRQLQPRIGFGWVNRIFGFIILAMLIATYLLLQPDHTHRRPKGPLFDPSAIRELPFVVTFVGLFFVFLGYWVPLIFVTPFAQFSLHTSSSYAFYLLAILNAGSFAGRILPALLAHRLGPAVILAAGGICLGILILAWMAIHTVAGITVWAVLVGFMAGITVAIPAAVVPFLCPSPSVVGARTGMAWSGAAIAGLIGSPIAGALVDRQSDDYAHGQAFGGAASLLGGILLIYPAITIARGNKRYARKEAPASEDLESSSREIEEVDKELR
jgi:MFS family permease